MIAPSTSTFNTHTHPFNGTLSRTTRVGRYQKGKSSLDFTEARDSEWQWHQLGHMQVCILLQTDNHASTPPLSFLQAGCPSCRPTNSVTHIKHCNSKQLCTHHQWCAELTSPHSLCYYIPIFHKNTVKPCHNRLLGIVQKCPSSPRSVVCKAGYGCLARFMYITSIYNGCPHLSAGLSAYTCKQCA